jgi:signal peptide peptidase SppA
MNYPALFRTFNDSLWAILPSKMEAICGFLGAKFAGLSLDAATVEKVAAGNRQAGAAAVTRSVAVLPIVGTISQRADLLNDFSGGTSAEAIGRQFDALLKDESVGCIVLDVDSPGGAYCGTPELAERIFSARGQKPIVSVANCLAASAAYWIASAADEVVASPSADVGSIGVLAVHYDLSEQNKLEGRQPTYITYGKYKAEFNQDSPLDPEALAELQRRVDEAGETFVKAVARNRGVAPQKVRDDFGQGRLMGAKEAVAAGVADRIDTLEATIARLAAGGRVKKGGKKARVERERLKLEEYR